jgi:hypothetical protein
MSEWRRRYQQAVLDGEISLAHSVDSYLREVLG